MAYYVQIVSVTRSRPTGVTIGYELRDDSAVPHTVVDTGSVGLEFGTTGTVAARRQAMRDSLTEVLQSIIERATVADVDYPVIAVALLGTRYPAGA